MKTSRIILLMTNQIKCLFYTIFRHFVSIILRTLGKKNLSYNLAKLHYLSIQLTDKIFHKYFMLSRPVLSEICKQNETCNNQVMQLNTFVSICLS